MSREKYPIENDAPLLPRRYGRDKSFNNDKELSKLGLEGYRNGTYRSYTSAAMHLWEQSRTYVGKGQWQRVGSKETIVDRLRRKIGAQDR